MKEALNAMMDATGVSGRGVEIDGLVQDDLNVSLSLDPKKISEEFDQLRAAAFKGGEDPEPVVWVDDAIHNSTSGAALPRTRSAATLTASGASSRRPRTRRS